MAQRPSYGLVSHRESFCHERLKLAENSIRLFQVRSGDKSEPLSLQITQYASHRRPPYRAISYTWGSSANLCEILVNGRAFKIHYNLWSLLFQLRLRKETAFLWADALCIDQANLRERNFHVQLMGRIYEQAKSVIVWLGRPSPDRTEIRALDFIKEMTVYRKSHGDVALGKTYLVADNRHRWETLLRMCLNRYWTRTWIVQEFLRAPQVEVVCGPGDVNWDEFENLLLMLQNAPFNQNETVRQILQSRPARLTLRRRARTASTLLELLGEYHDSMCTEQRDKVYGIMGLASDCGEDQATGQARGMVPDYNKHIVEVYLDAVSCIEKSLQEKLLLPSVANLVRQTLLLSDSEVANFINTHRPTESSLKKLMVIPDYISLVEDVLPSWTSIRDLKLQLASIDWGHYVGYEIKSPQPGLGKRASSRATHCGIPDDMLKNVINVAETEPETAYLHNYPQLPQLSLSPDHIALHPEDKRAFDNPNLDKPCIILEHNQLVNSLRLGVSCTNTRRGDMILQFRGLDTALICRQVRHEIVLVGKAVMVKHSQLKQEHELDPVFVQSPLLSPCLCSHNPERIELSTDALSLVELLTRR